MQVITQAGYPAYMESPENVRWLEQGVMIAPIHIVGSSNAVNLTDGLDSLAGSISSVAFACYGTIAYLQNQTPLVLFCFTVVGALLAFLWYNAHPAQMFMGDTGSLAIGGAMAMVAILIKQELVLVIVGGVFVMEALSVILQVASFKLTGRRIFRMAPLHHHFELKGWPEPRVIVRFWIITVILVLVGLASLKIR